MTFVSTLDGMMNVALTHNIGSWQGDWLGVVVDDGEYGDVSRGGFLTNSYGSCSGCDEWLAARTVEDRLAIITRLVNSIRWFDTPADMVAWLKSQAPCLEWFGHEPQWREFVAKVEKAAFGAAEWFDFVWNLAKDSDGKS